MKRLRHGAAGLAALCALQAGLAAPEPAAPTPSHLPAAVAGRVVELHRTERGAVERLRDEETALAQGLRTQRGQDRPAPAVPTTTLRIDGINGKPLSQVAFTPGALYVVQGSGFGGTRGQVRVTGQFPGGTLPVGVEMWLDTMIVLRVSHSFGGVPDRVGVGIEVRAGSGATATATGARFVAARETITLTKLPPSRIRWGVVAPMVEPAPGPAMRVRRHAEPVYTSVVAAPAQPCFGPGADDYDFSNLPFGFALVGYLWGYVQPAQTDPGGVAGSGASSGVSVDGDFHVETLGPGVRVHWASVRRISSNILLSTCTRSDSEYAIAFKVEGPRGLNPFQMLQANPAGVSGAN
jgi:hypothetical protein